jgi:hypothetical protein
MITSKNFYNYLNAIEISFFFKNEYFFIVEDSLNLSVDKSIKSNKFSRRQFVKANFKIHLTSSFFIFRNIKFPLFILFFNKSFFYEEFFFNFFFNNLIILFFKYKTQIFSLADLEYSYLLPTKLNLLNLDLNNSSLFTVLRISI